MHQKPRRELNCYVTRASPAREREREIATEHTALLMPHLRLYPRSYYESDEIDLGDQ